MRALFAGLALLVIGGVVSAEAQPFFGGGYGYGYRPGPRFYGPGYGYGGGYGRRCFIRPTPYGPRRFCRY